MVTIFPVLELLMQGFGKTGLDGYHNFSSVPIKKPKLLL